jgi:hypothetical protein
MSRQYCRYCVNCFEADDYRCSNHPKGLQPHFSESDIKRANNCPNYVETEDIITGRTYKPRTRKTVSEKYEQLSFVE